MMMNSLMNNEWMDGWMSQNSYFDTTFFTDIVITISAFASLKSASSTSTETETSKSSPN